MLTAGDKCVMRETLEIIEIKNDYVKFKVLETEEVETMEPKLFNELYRKVTKEMIYKLAKPSF